MEEKEKKKTVANIAKIVRENVLKINLKVFILYEAILRLENKQPLFMTTATMVPLRELMASSIVRCAGAI